MYTDIPRVADERTTLLEFLRWQRATLAWKCEGLTAAQLRTRSAPPSPLSLLGLVRHMTDVERGWFRRTLGQEDVDDVYETEPPTDADFKGVDDADPDDALGLWRTECDRADAIIAEHHLDDVRPQRSGRNVSMRWILVHMVEEYSRHNGHADLLREAVDGATGYETPAPS